MSGERLLVVDPEEGARNALVGALRGRGFEVQGTSQGGDGFTLLADWPADLVLCDVAAGTTGAHPLLPALSRERPDVPVIVITGETTLEEVTQALRFGASDYLAKPLTDTNRLVQAVDNALERMRLRRENSRVKWELEAANQQQRDHAEELRQDQRAGRQVQMSMLPPSPLTIEGFVLQHRIIPSLLLSGDFVDYFPIADHHFVFHIADVAGHGASSAFVTVLLKNFARRLRREYRVRMLMEPGEVLRWLNKELLESRLDRHVAMFLGIVDCSTGVVCYANAGHFPAPVRITSGEASFLEMPAKPLGLFHDAKFTSAQTTLKPGSTLALFSDGVLEVLPDLSLAEQEARLLAGVQKVTEASPGDLSALCVEFGLMTELEAPDDIACLLLSRDP